MYLTQQLEENTQADLEETRNKKVGITKQD